MGAEIDPRAVEPVTVRRCDIDRLKRKIAKLRFQRNEWRERAEIAEQRARDEYVAWLEKSRESSEKAARSAVWTLECDIKNLKAIIADKVIDKLKLPKAPPAPSQEGAPRS